MRFRFCMLLAVCLSFAGPVSAQNLFHVDFESPTYSVGAAHGQDNWFALYGYNDIVNTNAHSGSQSFRTVGAGGSRPFELPPYSMDVSIANDFWLETWVYVESGTGGSLAGFAAGNGLGAAFRFGIYDNGVVSFNDVNRNVGSSVLDKWLRIRIEHVGPSQDLFMSLTGPGVDESATVHYAAAGSVQSFIAVDMRYGGVAYWDDIQAAYGTVPVPEPAVGSILVLGAGLISLRFRKPARG